MDMPSLFPQSEFPEDAEPYGVNDHLTELSKTGYSYLKKGVLDEAEKAFHKILAISPTNSYGLTGLGDVYRRKGNKARAMAYYQQCLETSPENNHALLGMADCYKSGNQVDKALALSLIHI